jgi:tetratricopeptide (TPR) repeat protein
MSMSRRSRVAAGLALALLTIGAYARVAGNGFIDFDDQAYVSSNPMVQAGLTWRGIAWAFTTSRSANWHPLTWISHMLDVQVYGMNAGGHHLTSLALHVASTLLLFYLFLRMTEALYPSVFVAAVFGLHPLHVESVAWVAERKDVLSAFFWISTTLAYVSWTEKKGTARYVAVLALFALGLLSKPMLVTLPFTLLLFDVWPLQRPGWPLLFEKIPLFLLAASSSVITFLVQRGYGAMLLSERVPFGLRAENALVAYASYLGKAIAPVGLAVFYPHPAQAYPAWQVAGAALLLIATTAFALQERRNRPWLAIGWLWFLGTLVPVIGLVQVGPQALADRYTYLPMIGLSAAVGFGAAELSRRSAAARHASASLLVVAVAGWTAITWRQVGLWKDDRTLFGHMVEIMPGNHLGYGILGNVNLREGHDDAAILDYRRALELQPGYPLWLSNLGRAYLLSGRIPEAKAAFEAALRSNPDLAAAHHHLGYILAIQGDLDGAIEHDEAALRSDPDLPEAHYNLGGALMQKGRIDEAIAHCERALEIAPDFAPARNLLEAARAARNRPQPR